MQYQIKQKIILSQLQPTKLNKYLGVEEGKEMKVHERKSNTLDEIN